MSTAAIIAISAVVVLFLVLLVGSAITLILVILRAQRHILSFSQSLAESLSELQDANLAHREALTKSFSHHQSQLDLLSTTIRTTLDSNYARLQATVEQIQGKALIEAIGEFKELIRQQAAATSRIESAGIGIAEIAKTLVSEETISGSAIDRARQSGLLPESYAPNPTNLILDISAYFAP